MALEFTKVAVRPVQKRVENEFLAVVKEIKESGETLAVTFPHVTDAEKKAVRVALQHLTQAGNEHGVTVRRVTESDGKTATVTFWTQEKIRKAPKEKTEVKPVAKPAPAKAAK